MTITSYPPTLFEIQVTDGLVQLDVAQDSYTCRYAPGLERASMAMGDNPEWRALPHASATLGVRTVYRFIGSLLRTAVAMQRLDFDRLIASAEATIRDTSPRAFDPDRYSRVVSSFETLLLWVPFRFQCLFRAYWLIQFLARHDLSSDWRFGATLFPFEAHCWVSHGKWLLGERAHRLEGLAVLATFGDGNR